MSLRHRRTSLTSFSLISHQHTLQGGAVAIVGATKPAAFTGALFALNRAAAADGGAIAVTRGSRLALSQCVLQGNAARGDGGAVSAADCPEVIFMDTGFAANRATSGGPLGSSRGGAVSAVNVSSLRVSGCAFAENAVVDASGSGAASAAASGGIGGGGQQQAAARYRSGDGGSLFILGGGPSLSSPTAATASQQQSADISDTLFQSNAALGSGGALAVWGAAAATLRGCNFSSNAAQLNGGALAAGSGAGVTAVSTRFTNNAAGSADSPSSGAASLTIWLGIQQDSGNGGAVWVSRGGAAALSGGCAAASNAAARSGGFAFVEQRGSLAASDFSADGCTAEIDGGVFALSGAAALSLTRTNISSSRALLGGFLSFRQSADTLSAIRLSAVTFENVSAAAGAIFALADTSAREVSPPPCDDGGCGLPCATCAATGYGPEAATLPATMAVSAPSRAASGGPTVVSIEVFDALRQRVRDFLSMAFQIDCVASFGDSSAPAAQADPSLAQCDFSTLLGAVRSGYRNGSATFSPLLVFGAPGVTYALRASLSNAGGDATIRPVYFNVTVNDCRRAGNAL